MTIEDEEAFEINDVAMRLFEWFRFNQIETRDGVLAMTMLIGVAIGTSATDQDDLNERVSDTKDIVAGFALKELLKRQN